MMDPGGLDGQRAHVDLASTSGHFPPSHRSLIQQNLPHQNTTHHTLPTPPPHASAGPGHVPTPSPSGPLRMLPLPNSTSTPPTTAHSDPRHIPGPQQQQQPAAAYPRSYSVDSGVPHSAPLSAGREGPPPTPTGPLPPTTNMAHANPHPPVYVEQHQPNGMGPHGHHAMPLMPHHDQYQHPGQPPTPMHHHTYPGPQYAAAPAPYQHTPQYEPNQYNRGTGPKKAVRAQQACQQCRTRKQKCDEGRPRCGFCDKENMNCEYKETQPPKQDRTILEILAGIREIREDHKVLRQEMKILQQQNRIAPHSRSGKRKRPETSLDEAERRTISPATSLDYGEPMDEDSEETETAAQSAFSDPVIAKEVSGQPPYSTYQHAQQMHDNITAQIMGEEMPGAGGIPADHRTSVTHLATWPGIKELYSLGGFENRKSITQYEEDQGILRVYGVGQTGDRLEEKRPDYTAESPASDSSDPLEPEGLWGSNQLDGPLRLDEVTVKRLYDSYFKHFHILHPFLDRTRLKRMLQAFVTRYRTDPSPSVGSPFVVPGVPSDPHYNASGSKRSTSNHFGTPSMESPIPTPDYGKDVPLPHRQIEQNVSSAIILLVMALGKIAEHTDHLKGPARPGDQVAILHNQHSPHTVPSPSNSVKPSPAPSHATLSSIQSPSASEQRSDLARNLDNLASKRQLRNIDVFPGLAYYATAADILDFYVRSKNVPGDTIGHHLHQIWAFLLAGLYMGQLCRPMESFIWIERACKAWLRLRERYPDLALDVMHSATKDVDLVKFAYWTCLQLESDIRAELNFEPTGIGKYEEKVAYPNGVTDDLVRHELQPSADEDIVCYCLQIALRKTLNRTHTFVYGSDKELIWDTEGRRSYGGPKEMLAELDEFRERVAHMPPAPEDLRRWQDASRPSSDINVARVRGKYYGAQYVILRPFLQHAMNDFAAQPVEVRYVKASELPLIKLSRDHVDSQKDPEYTKRVIGAAVLCIEAAMESTIAFDGLKPKRFIVTNIHGTALAQFGNMIVLCAAYFSWLGPSHANLVPRGRLMKLLDRTIDLMNALAPLSRVMYDNEIILRAARRKIETTPDPNGENSGAGVRGIQSAHSSFGV